MTSLRKEKVWQGFKRIVAAWPDARLSNTFRHIYIPSIKLPSQFNYASTPLTIKLNLDSDYVQPEAYVDRNLRVYGSRSYHLDERLTEKEMLEGGWVKLCVIVNWNPNLSLVDYLIMVIDFLENLKR